MKWIHVTPGKRPFGLKKYRHVLVQIAAKEKEGLPPAVGVGYWKHRSDGALWVIPGIGGTVTHFCDCLGDEFDAPLWEIYKPENDGGKR